MQFHGSRINFRPLISCSRNRDQAGKAIFLTQSSNMVTARVATTLEQKEGMRGMLCSFMRNSILVALLPLSWEKLIATDICKVNLDPF